MAKETILNRGWFVRHRLHFAFCLELRNRCFTQYFEISMAKIEDQPQVTPERLMQFGFAYAPPLIIGAAVANKSFRHPGGRAKIG